jgi:hypothetical protein
MRARQLARPIASENIILAPHQYHQLNSKQQILYAIALFFVLEISACADTNNAKAPTHNYYNYSANTTDRSTIAIAYTHQVSPTKTAQRHKKKLHKEKFIEPEWSEPRVQGGLELDFLEDVPKQIKMDTAKAVSNKTDTIPAIKATKKSHAFRAWLKKLFS